MLSARGRKRSRQACKTCRDLKRRCDGANPCGACVRFEYERRYEAARSRHRARHITPTQYKLSNNRETLGHPSRVTPPDAQARTAEANSRPTFFRKLSKRLNPKGNSRNNTFGWNSFLCSRQANHVGTARPVHSILTQAQMQHLATVYLEKLDPTYGFLDHREIWRLIHTRWTTSPVEPLQDAMLCGVAAIGCLFSYALPNQMEANLVETARAFLTQTASEEPSTMAIKALLLRVVYLRIASTHYQAWAASCATMHMIDVVGLHLEDSSEPAMEDLQEDTDVESRRRVVSVAQHLNTCMSFDMGLAYVTLPNLPVPVPSVREGDCTRELVELLPFNMELDPARKPTAADLEHALFTVLDREHTVPSSTLAQCNLALCLCRRLRSMEASRTEPVLQQIVTLTSKVIRAARELLMSRAPWHQMTFIPFQIVCVLLVIDTVSSMSQLRDAMQCIKDVSEV